METIIYHIKRKIAFIGGLILPFSPMAQNLVPNPSFEDTTGCIISIPDINCLDIWKDANGSIAAMNTPDLCFNGAIFFPPSSIPALDGTKYIGLDCQPMNSEYVQSPLLQELVAGKSYCVSFYVSVCDQTATPAISLGTYFSDGPLIVNPYDAGLSAHVQGNVPTDPTIWTKVSGIYVATGGEDHITLGGFQNMGGPAFVYMYIDMVEVYEIPDQNNFLSLEICPDATLDLTASGNAASYLWNTNETTSTISISQSGLFVVEKTYGSCVLTDTFLVTNGNCIIDTTVDSTIIDSVEIQTLFIPSAFSPNQDGLNDVWTVYGENLTDLDVIIFNRWGEVIFQSSQVNFAWDGKRNGQMLMNDVYVYQINFKNQLGVIEQRRGKVVLVR